MKNMRSSETRIARIKIVPSNKIKKETASDSILLAIERPEELFIALKVLC